VFRYCNKAPAFRVASIANRRRSGKRGLSAPWTRDKDKQLLRLQAKGLSASQIGEQLGTTRSAVTRSAVLGRSARLLDVVFSSQTRRHKTLSTRRRRNPGTDEAWRQWARLREVEKAIRTRLIRQQDRMPRLMARAWPDNSDYGECRVSAFASPRNQIRPVGSESHLGSDGLFRFPRPDEQRRRSMASGARMRRRDPIAACRQGSDFDRQPPGISGCEARYRVIA
jgi:GcrA cell cycle regulator